MMTKLVMILNDYTDMGDRQLLHILHGPQDMRGSEFSQMTIRKNKKRNIKTFDSKPSFIIDLGCPSFSREENLKVKSHRRCNTMSG